MVAFWTRQPAERTDESAMESLHKACLAGLDTVLCEMAVDITGDKMQCGATTTAASTLLGSIQHSVARLARDSDDSAAPATIDALLDQVDDLLLSDLWMLTTAHIPLARTLVCVLRTLHLSTDYPATTQHTWDQVQTDIADALEHIPPALADTEAIRGLRRHCHDEDDDDDDEDDDERPPAYADVGGLSPPLQEKPPQYDELDRIMAAVFRLSSTGFSNQRVEMLHPLPQKRSLTDLLAKSLHRPSYSRQRFQLSSDKERDLFMNGLLHKVDRLEGRRLSNQDAEPPRYDELGDLLQHICRAKRTRLDNQRAVFTHATALLRSSS